MPRKKLDVDQIGWSEQIKENVSVSGSLTVTGSVKVNDTIDLHEDGFLDLKKNGFIGPQSVMINDPNSAFIGAHWIKVARRDTGEGLARPMSGQTSHSVFLMTFAGREGASDYATRNEFLVTVKFSPTNSGSPHYLSSGTHVTVEPLDSSDLDGWDPTSYIALSIEDNSYPAVELWIRSSETHKHLYCTYLGGNNNVRKADGSLAYVNPALELLTGQAPASSITSLGNEVYGRWAEKVFNKIGIGTQTSATELHLNGALTIGEKASDPSDPAEGQSVLWMSDGTGTGDDGDILVKITAGGVTKTVTLVDFSAS